MLYFRKFLSYLSWTIVTPRTLIFQLSVADITPITVQDEVCAIRGQLTMAALIYVLMDRMSLSGMGDT